MRFLQRPKLPRRHRPTRVRALTANIYRGNKRLDAARATIRKSGAHVVGTQETPRNGFHVDGYTTFQKRDEPYSDGVAILLDSDLEVDGHGFHRLTERCGPRPGFDAPRWAVVVDFRIGDQKVTAINCHFPVPDTRAAVAAYQVYLAGVLAIAAAKRAAGRRVILLGDLNSVARVVPALRRAGFGWVRNHVDYIAALGLKLGRRTVIRKRRTGSDHNWVATTLTIDAD
ncbi:MAG: endonuclease/exonuclease/phosphatase family protein [Nocardioides sp.]